MSAVHRRRLDALERKHGHNDWQRYLGTPFNEWPDRALNAYLGNPTDEQLEEIIAELQAKVDADTSIAASSQS